MDVHIENVHVYKVAGTGPRLFLSEEQKRFFNAMAAEVHSLLPLLETGETLMADFTKLASEIAELKTVNASAISLLTGLSEQVRAIGPNQAKLDAFADDLDKETAALAASIVANTPAAAVEPIPEPAPADPAPEPETPTDG
jgi:ABC-type transporter Mla MlaB component